MTSPRDLRSEADLDRVKSHQRTPHASQLYSVTFPRAAAIRSLHPFPLKPSNAVASYYADAVLLGAAAAAAAAAAGIIAASTGARKGAPGSILLHERVSESVCMYLHVKERRRR